MYKNKYIHIHVHVCMYKYWHILAAPCPTFSRFVASVFLNHIISYHAWFQSKFKVVTHLTHLIMGWGKVNLFATHLWPVHNSLLVSNLAKRSLQSRFNLTCLLTRLCTSSWVIHLFNGSVQVQFLTCLISRASLSWQLFHITCVSNQPTPTWLDPWPPIDCISIYNHMHHSFNCLNFQKSWASIL